MGEEKLFFRDTKNKTSCRHASFTQCETAKCWYSEHLTHSCLHALHGKDSHSKCEGEYLVGYTGKNGASLHLECECLCHDDKYYSPLTGRWV